VRAERIFELYRKGSGENNGQLTTGDGQNLKDDLTYEGIETFFSEKGIREKENAVPGHCSHVGFNQITRKFR